MTQTQTHITYKGLIIVLVIALVVPSFVKLAHIFENHKHEVCEAPQKSHFHEFDVDCEFYKFKLNPQTTTIFNDFVALSLEENFKLISSQYQFISDYQRLSFSLRGPPSLV